MKINGLDYNTKRETLLLPEYGREIQEMVEYCTGLPSRQERLRCAKTIVAVLPDTGERYLSTVLYAFEEYPL